jgi:hypothetical protein
MAKRGGEMPSQAELHRVLEYFPETGKFVWRHRPEARQSWNTRYAGKQALTSRYKGYLWGNVLGSRTLLAHRIAFKYAFGREPFQIDHINGDRSDNRLCNLREVTCSENRRNSARPRNNTSGIIGVSRVPSGNWLAQIKVGGIIRSLGTYQSREEAGAARKAAEERLGFHPNHGRAA